MALNSTVDDSDSVFLSCNECRLPFLASTNTVCVVHSSAVEGVCAVNESSAESWWSSLLGDIPQLIDSLVAPVRQEHHSEVLVVVGSGRSIDDQRSQKSVTVLSCEMGMVPSRTVLSCLELVGVGLARCDWALSNTWNSVHFCVVKLTDSMPVNRCAVNCEVIGNVNDEVVSPVSDDGWARSSAIEG